MPAYPLHRFRPRLLDALQDYRRAHFLCDLSAGLTVGIVALPLAMAFAIASGVKPEQGLYTAIIAGLLISALGGSTVQIGGPAGAFVVIVYGIVAHYGLANLLIATALAGLLLMLMGLLRLGVLVRYVPVAIVIGFTNGIAVLILLSQVKDALGLAIAKMPADFFSQIGALAQHAAQADARALAVAGASLAIVATWRHIAVWAAVLAPTRGNASTTLTGSDEADAPTINAASAAANTAHADASAATAGRGSWLLLVPGTLVALMVTTVAVLLLKLPVETIGSRYSGIPQGLPQFAWPDFSWANVQQLAVPTLTIALLGAVESLLCARVADNVGGNTTRHDPNQELMAQGIANFVTPFFGGIPATGTIARTMTNVRAGAASPIAGIVHALTLLAIVLVAAPWAAHVPLAALAGIMVYVAWNMGDWKQLLRAQQFPPSYRVLLLGTFVLTIVFDLTVAVQIGLALACGFFIWRMGTLFQARPLVAPGSALWPEAAPLIQDDTADVPPPPGVHVVQLYGALFFGAVGRVEALTDELPDGCRALILQAHQLVMVDTTGLDALEQLHRRLARRGVQLVLVALNDQPLALMRQMGFLDGLGAQYVTPDLAGAYALLRA